MSNSNNIIYSKTTKTRKWIYASPRFGISIFIGLIDFALLFLYNDVFQLNSNDVGTGLMLGKFAIAISQFFFGWVSDHTHTKWGRRKPYLFILTPIMTISFVMLLLPGIFLGANPSQSALFAWFIIFNCLAQASYAVTTVYHSWTAEQFSMEERPTVSQYQNSLNFIGTAIVVIFSMLVLTNVKDEFSADPSKVPFVYLLAIIIFSLILIFFNYLCAIKMPIEKTPEYTSKLLDDLKVILRNKNLILVCLLQGICSLTWAMASSLLVKFADDVLKLSTFQYIIASGVMIITMIFALSLWRRFIEKKGKKKALLGIFTVAIVSLPFSLLGRFAFSANLWFAIPYIALVAAAMGGWYLFPYIMYADLAEEDTNNTGELKAGIYTGFPAIILNIFQAISLKFTAWILSWRTIINVPDTDPFSSGLIYWGPIGSLILIVSLIYAKKFIKLDFGLRDH